MAELFKRLFEEELERRGRQFTIDLESDRYVFSEPDGERFFLSTENVKKRFLESDDPAVISSFLDLAFAKFEGTEVDSTWDIAKKNIFWCVEPTSYVESPPLTRPISKDACLALVELSRDAGLITWVTPSDLTRWDITLEELQRIADENLNAELTSAEVQYVEGSGVKFGIIASQLPFKATLAFATTLKARVEDDLGWPLMAIIPARDFLLLWNASDNAVVGQVGTTAVTQFTQSPYPISPELFEISDGGVRAIGAFKVPI